MRKKSLLAIFVLTVLSFVVTKASFATIVGSVHDFKGRSWSGGQICVVCHTPHNARGNTLAPLWNHATTATNSFTLYTSPTLKAALAQPSGASKACLSCHDGTVAYDSFGGSTGTHFVSGSDNLGTDLSNDHPISFTYDAALATNDGGLYDPTTKAAFGGKTVDQAMLIAHKLECSSCHDVHKNKGASTTSSELLLVNNAGSALCLTCHNK